MFGNSRRNWNVWQVYFRLTFSFLCHAIINTQNRSNLGLDDCQSNWIYSKNSKIEKIWNFYELLDQFCKFFSHKLFIIESCLIWNLYCMRLYFFHPILLTFSCLNELVILKCLSRVKQFFHLEIFFSKTWFEMKNFKVDFEVERQRNKD
jgi:hypothetical protein